MGPGPKLPISLHALQVSISMPGWLRYKLLLQNAFWPAFIPKPCPGANTRDDFYSIWEKGWVLFHVPVQPGSVLSIKDSIKSCSPVAYRTEFCLLCMVERQLWGTALLCPPHPFLPSSLPGFHNRWQLMAQPSRLTSAPVCPVLGKSQHQHPKERGLNTLRGLRCPILTIRQAAVLGEAKADSSPCSCSKETSWTLLGKSGWRAAQSKRTWGC